ncbi:replication initiation protein, partial [Methylobacter sp. BlB1]|uniref:replication initiation protein n=1 Tax=Methylobacter sp. BlB1 TaxID=2785914 RepID=UPI0018935C79
SSYSFSLIEQRLLNMCIGSIYYEKFIKPETKCTVKLDRYILEYGISRKEGLKQFKDIQGSLGHKEVILPEYDQIPIRWVDKIDFECSDELYINFNEEIIPHISKMKSHFISYDLCHIRLLNSPHSIRLYELCKSVAHDRAQWRLEIELVKLKLILGLENRYALYADFKRLLDKCISEINVHTDINVSYAERKLGKKVVKIVFSVSSKGSINTISKK